MVNAMRNCRRWSVAAAAGLLMSVVQSWSAAAQDFSTGLREFYHGDHAAAARIWERPAAGGDAKAQSGMGFLYLFGFGVAQDIDKAVFWYAKAADQNEPEAQAYLGAFYVAGRGVQRDLVQALKWCELAVWYGTSRGMSCREQALRQMSADQMHEGWRLVTEWVDQHPRMAWR